MHIIFEKNNDKYSKEEIRENIRTEYDFLCRRLELLFEKTPDFAHAPIIDCNQQDVVVEYDEDGLFKKGELQTIF